MRGAPLSFQEIKPGLALLTATLALIRRLGRIQTIRPLGTWDEAMAWLNTHQNPGGYIILTPDRPCSFPTRRGRIIL